MGALRRLMDLVLGTLVPGSEAWVEGFFTGAICTLSLISILGLSFWATIHGGKKDEVNKEDEQEGN